MGTGTYFKDNTETGSACELVVKSKSLYIYLQDTGKSLFIWKLDASVEVAFDGKLLRLLKPLTGERLECSGEIALLALAAHNQPEEVKKEERRPLVTYAPFFITASVVLLVALAGYFLFLPWLGRQLIGFIPVSVETQLGDALSRQYVLQYKANDSATYYANKFCEQIRFNTVYPIHVEVLESEELNAFALPGGRTFVYSGLLKKLDNYDELAALLGHEASHVIHRHSLKSILRSAAAGVVISALFGNISEISAWVLSRADDFKQLDYSRELETEADDEGFKLMLQNGVDPNGMLRLLKLLKKEGAEMPAMMKYLSTHPETDERIANIEGKPEIKNKYSEKEKLQKLFVRLKAHVNN
jgi:predicted Zn-dependent protease